LVEFVEFEVKYFSAVTGEEGGKPVKCLMRTQRERIIEGFRM